MKASELIIDELPFVRLDVDSYRREVRITTSNDQYRIDFDSLNMLYDTWMLNHKGELMDFIRFYLHQMAIERNRNYFDGFMSKFMAVK